MAFLENAQNFKIQTLNINEEGKPGPREYLNNRIAPGAIHDSSERCDAPACLEGTRVAVQDEIIRWGIRGDGEPQDILWLTGPAGAGKTAIAGSIAEAFQNRGLLAASYFFSSFEGTEARRSKKYMVATLAHQIAQLPGLEVFASRLFAAIGRDPSIFDKRLKTQLETLILAPLQEMRILGHPLPSSAIIVVDGVDEVVAESSAQLPKAQAQRKNEIDQCEVIKTLLQAASAGAHFPFRILIASRPEENIRDTLEQIPSAFRELFLDDDYAPDSDIELYFRFEFSKIRLRYLPELPSWPAEEDIQQLVDAASGQFIYAVTVVRYIQSRANTPQVLLDAILKVQNRDLKSNPLEPLHLLYDHILFSSPDPWLSAAWLRNMWTTTLSEKPAFFIRQLLEHQPGLAHHLLGSLTSLVHIPSFAHAHSSSYRFYHRSLLEFLFRITEDFPADHHDLLKERRIGAVLQAKGPCTPLAAAEWGFFLPHFIDAALGCCYQLFERSTGLDTSAGGALAQCDVVWWMEMAVSVHPDRDLELVSAFFNEVHLSCITESDCCTAACLHWRSSILRFCKKRLNGWRAPHPSVLLRERLFKDMKLWHTDVEEIDELIDERPDFLFYTFKHQSGTTLTPDELQETRDEFPCFEPGSLADYKGLLSAVDTLHDYFMPDDWDDRYLAELAQGVSIYEILKEEVDSAVTNAGYELSYY